MKQERKENDKTKSAMKWNERGVHHNMMTYCQTHKIKNNDN
jgi:hypothetical protein